MEVRAMIRADMDKQLERTGFSASKLLSMYGVSRSTFYGWTEDSISPQEQRRYNPATILPQEEQAVLEYRATHRNVGYRKLTHMMNDAEVAFLSESTVYSILSRHDLLGPFCAKGSDAEDEYRHKPKAVHEHWHTDLAYVKIKGVFYFLSMILDGYSRYILGWELLTDMTTLSVQDLFLRVRKQYPNGSPKLINDNGSCYISKDFKQLVSQLDIQQVFTRRNHPETNGKAERFMGTMRQEALRIHYPSSFKEAEQVIGDFVSIYNHKRLHAGIRFVRPVDMFTGRAQQVLDKRKVRLEAAKQARIQFNKQQKREAAYN